MTSPAVAKTMKQAAKGLKGRRGIDAAMPVKLGVDLGTAFTVLMVTDENDKPLAGASVFADVVRDGIVWDYAGAIGVVTELKASLEKRIGRRLVSGSVTIPPDVGVSDARAHRYVLEGAGIECTEVVNEPVAANAVLGLSDGAVVDIGGGTTGIAIIRDGEVVTTVDEPSGGTHLSLVLSGALKVGFDEAEELKRDPANHQRLLPLVAPVMEKMGTIVARAIAGHQVEQVVLVGGTCAFTGIDSIMSRVTGVPCTVAPEPMLVTPLGVARWATPHTDQGGF